MADISKIKLPNGTTYDIKDEGARANYVQKSAEMQTTNSFAPNSLKGPYISKIDNAFYAADKRWTVTGTNISSISSLFDGSYETNAVIGPGKTSVITMDFSPTTYFPGYPYGYILVSVYYTARPESITCRAYCNYEPHGIGWFNIPMEMVADSANASTVYRGRQGRYNISKIEFTIKGQTTGSYQGAYITQIEMHLDRPDSSRNPFLSKYSAETLYYNLTAPKFIGNLQGNADTVNNHTVNADVPSGAKFTDTTYTGTSPITVSNANAIGINTASTSGYGATKLNSATNSTSTTEAATPSAVKTAKDRADEAYSKAATVESGLNGTLIYDHTYSISNGVATFTAHVYQKGVEVTSNYADSCFEWSYKLANAVTGTPSVVSLGTGKTKTITISTLGYGGYVLGTFTPPA